MEKILITTSRFSFQNNPALEALDSYSYEIVLNPYERKLTESEVAQLLVDTNAVGIIAGVEPLTSKVLSMAKALKVISRCGVGMDNVDMGAVKELGIQVFNTPATPAKAVAELTIGLMLSLLRGVVQSNNNIRQGEFYRPMGGLLSGKTVGIIGCGRIGQAVIKLLQPFGVRIVSCDPCCQSFPKNVKACQLDELLMKADVVSLHLPYTENTHHLISSRELELMSNTSFLINTARGGLIDELSLYQALKSGCLAGAALDCFLEEPYYGPLVELKNVILTAHIGGYTRETRKAMEVEAANNILIGLGLEEAVVE